MTSPDTASPSFTSPDVKPPPARSEGADLRTLIRQAAGLSLDRLPMLQLIFDRLATGCGDALKHRVAGIGPLTVEGLLHLAPEALVALSGPHRAFAQQGARRISLAPWMMTGRRTGLELTNGRNDRPGTLQGFVAGPQGLVPATALTYRFAGTEIVCGGMLITTDATLEERLTRLLEGEALKRFLAA